MAKVYHAIQMVSSDSRHAGQLTLRESNERPAWQTLLL